jgi:hypothetical protein
VYGLHPTCVPNTIAPKRHAPSSAMQQIALLQIHAAALFECDAGQTHALAVTHDYHTVKRKNNATKQAAMQWHPRKVRQPSMWAVPPFKPRTVQQTVLR